MQRGLVRGQRRVLDGDWLLTYRRRALPVVLAAIAAHADGAAVHLLHDPAAVERFLAGAR